jgi:CPA1 family monovalent cation:H+ antiporter
MAIENVGQSAIEQNLEQFLLVLSVSLSVATLSRVFSWFRKIPYTLLLVIVGLFLAFVDVRLVNLSPGLILEIFLPPLLFEAAWNLKWRDLRQNWVPVVLYAIFGVMISVVGIGLALNRFAAIPIATALLAGTTLAATDPVSVIALFKELGAGKKLKTIMEGESLFNDGVAVVAFSLLVGIPLGLEEFNLPVSVARFFVFVGVGIGVGALIGFGISYLTQRFDLPLVEQSLTLVSAYGTYLITENLGGSGVIGVVTTALILGNFGSRIGMNPRTRLLVTEFWDFLAFFVNSIVFLLIGDQVRYDSLANDFWLILLAIVAVLLTRLVSTFLLGFISNAITEVDVSWQEQLVLWWGGLRGSVSIALVLSLPVALGGREEITNIVFGVVLFTLLVQGLTTGLLLEKLNLIGDQKLRQEYSEMIARSIALTKVMKFLSEGEDFRKVDPEFYRYQAELVGGQLKTLEEKSYKMIVSHPELREMVNEQVRDKLLDIEADTYAELIRSGWLNEQLSPLLQDVLGREDDL